ncbi:MAG: hypothetical protein ACT4PV_09260 [Planctomycetaceae bacterium]
MKIYVEFDNSFCPDPPAEKPSTPPDPAACDLVRRWTRAGHQVVFYSVRANACAADGWRARHSARELAEYLARHQIPYHGLHLAKPEYDLLVDGKAIPFDGDWRNLKPLFVLYP